MSAIIIGILKKTNSISDLVNIVVDLRRNRDGLVETPQHFHFVSRILGLDSKNPRYRNLNSDLFDTNYFSKLSQKFFFQRNFTYLNFINGSSSSGGNGYFKSYFNGYFNSRDNLNSIGSFLLGIAFFAMLNWISKKRGIDHKSNRKNNMNKKSFLSKRSSSNKKKKQ